MITSKPKHSIKRMLPEDAPQPAELPESEDSGEGFESARALAAAAPPARPRWVRQVMDYVERAVPPEYQVQNLAQLHKLLRRALLIEHSTIPPYLTALYSIKDGTNAESVQLIRGVLVEEMLHMILAANVLNAVGGEPAVNDPRFIPTYPLDLTKALQPNDSTDDSKILGYLVGRAEAEGFESAGGGPKDVRVEILKFSKKALDIFIAIETPERKGPSGPGPVTTIGEFYTIIIHGLERLEEAARREGKTIFNGDPALQVGPEHYYGSGGGAFKVADLKRARAALAEIICQGEGFKEICYDESADLGEYEELGHYFRFMEIRKERYYAPGDKPGDDPSGPPLKVDWKAVHNMKPNPRLRDFKGDPGLEALGRAFNETYLRLLDQIQRAFTGEPSALQDAVVTMFDLKYAAGGLLRIPLGDGPLTAGPVFGPGPRRKKK